MNYPVAEEVRDSEAGLSEEDRHYIAGVLESSGHFHTNTVKRVSKKTGEVKTYVYPRMRLFSTKQDFIDNLIRASGVGSKIYNRYEKRGKPYHMWVWSVARREELEGLVIEILPLLSEERKRKILEVL